MGNLIPKAKFNYMNRYNYLSSLLLLVSSLFAISAFAQHPAGFKDQRAEEDYSNLKDSTNLDALNAVKFIALDKQRTSYLTLGGSFRPRFEDITNQFWVPTNDQSYYSQRITFHTDWHFGNLRVFGELQHGYKTGGPGFVQTDDIDVHQGFIEVKTNSPQLSLRFGRQEMRLGVGRLFDFGVGPNIRQTFDIGKITFNNDKANIQAFYGKAVRAGFKAFDNQFNLFNKNAPNPKVWGIYNQFPIPQNDGGTMNAELYYIGYQSNQSTFNDVMGKETRHSTGIRLFGNARKKFTFNTELIYQFGDIADNSIGAFNFETDWLYSLADKKWRPILGLKLDWSSGDRNLADGEINSFNPMFVNPALYSLAVVNTPVNLLSFHPSITVFPIKKSMIKLEFTMFFRSSENDGLYSPPSRQTRPTSNVSSTHIGNVIGLLAVYNFNKYINFTLRTSYFIPGDFVKESGPSDDIFQFSPTITFTF